NSRLVALGAVGLGTAALIEDLGRPERFLNMMRTFKVTSPMSLGTWLLGGFGTVSGVLGAIEVDRMVGEKVPLRSLRGLVHGMETPLALAQGALGPALASYTGALLADTAVPTWAASRDHLSYLFVSSASLATGGAAMVTTPVVEAGPARLLAAAGVVGDGPGRHQAAVGRAPGDRGRDRRPRRWPPPLDRRGLGGGAARGVGPDPLRGARGRAGVGQGPAPCDRTAEGPARGTPRGRHH